MGALLTLLGGILADAGRGTVNPTVATVAFLAVPAIIGRQQYSSQEARRAAADAAFDDLREVADALDGIASAIADGGQEGRRALEKIQRLRTQLAACAKELSAHTLYEVDQQYREALVQTLGLLEVTTARFEACLLDAREGIAAATAIPTADLFATSEATSFVAPDMTSAFAQVDPTDNIGDVPVRGWWGLGRALGGATAAFGAFAAGLALRSAVAPFVWPGVWPGVGCVALVAALARWTAGPVTAAHKRQLDAAIKALQERAAAIQGGVGREALFVLEAEARVLALACLLEPASAQEVQTVVAALQAELERSRIGLAPVTAAAPPV